MKTQMTQIEKRGRLSAPYAIGARSDEVMCRAVHASSFYRHAGEHEGDPSKWWIHFGCCGASEFGL